MDTKVDKPQNKETQPNFDTWIRTLIRHKTKNPKQTLIHGHEGWYSRKQKKNQPNLETWTRRLIRDKIKNPNQTLIHGHEGWYATKQRTPTKPWYMDTKIDTRQNKEPQPNLDTWTRRLIRLKTKKIKQRLIHGICKNRFIGNVELLIILIYLPLTLVTNLYIYP